MRWLVNTEWESWPAIVRPCFLKSAGRGRRSSVQGGQDLQVPSPERRLRRVTIEGGISFISLLAALCHRYSLGGVRARRPLFVGRQQWQSSYQHAQTQGAVLRPQCMLQEIMGLFR